MNNKVNGKHIRIVLEVVILFFAVAVAWATLRGDVKDNVNHISNHNERITTVEQSLPEIKGDIRVILTEQKHISKGIEEIKESLK